MENENSEKLGSNPLLDRLEDFTAAIACLAGALVRSGAVTEQQIREEALDMLRLIDAPEDQKVQFLPVTYLLSRFSAPKLGQPAPVQADSPQ